MGIMLEVKKELLQAVVDYLQEQPFKEVYRLINALMACKPIVSDNNNREK